jgi:hypothetical protein
LIFATKVLVTAIVSSNTYHSTVAATRWSRSRHAAVLELTTTKDSSVGHQMRAFLSVRTISVMLFLKLCNSTMFRSLQTCCQGVDLLSNSATLLSVFFCLFLLGTVITHCRPALAHLRQAPSGLFVSSSSDLLPLQPSQARGRFGSVGLSSPVLTATDLSC